MTRIIASLKKLIGRTKVNKVTISIGFGASCLTTGFTILFITNDFQFKILGAILAFMGIALCATGFIVALNEDEKDRNLHKYYIQSADMIVTELQNIGKSLEEIKKGKEGNDKPKQ